MSIQASTPAASGAYLSAGTNPATTHTGGPAGKNGAGPADSVNLSGGLKPTQPTTIPQPEYVPPTEASVHETLANDGGDLPANVQNPDAFESHDDENPMTQQGEAVGENPQDIKDVTPFTRRAGPVGKTGAQAGLAPDPRYADKPATKLSQDPSSLTGNIGNTLADKGAEQTAEKAAGLASSAIKNAVRTGAMAAEVGSQALKAMGPPGFAASAVAGSATGMYGLYKACKSGTAEDQRKAALTLAADFCTGGAYTYIHDAFASPDRPLTHQEKSLLAARSGQRPEVNSDSGRLPG